MLRWQQETADQQRRTQGSPLLPTRRPSTSLSGLGQLHRVTNAHPRDLSSASHSGGVPRLAMCISLYSSCCRISLHIHSLPVALNPSPPLYLPYSPLPAPYSTSPQPSSNVDHRYLTNRVLITGHAIVCMCNPLNQALNGQNIFFTSYDITYSPLVSSILSPPPLPLPPPATLTAGIWPTSRWGTATSLLA